MATLPEYGLQPPVGGEGSASVWAAAPDTVGILYEDPAELANGNVALRALFGAEGAEWAGCSIYVSHDGVTYTRLFQAPFRAYIGVLLTPLAAGPDYDPAGTCDIEITLSPRDLATTDLEGLFRGVNRAIIGNEIVSWQTAVLIGVNQYRLTGFYRSWYDTEIEAHPAGTPIRQLSFLQTVIHRPVEEVGDTWFYKAVSYNGAGVEGDVGAVAAQQITLTRRGLHLEFQEGRTKQYIAGEVLEDAQHVYLSRANERVYLAVSDSEPKLGLVQSPGVPVVAGEKVYVQHDGLYTAITEPTPTGANWTWNPGAYLYGCDVPGNLSETPDGYPPVALCLDVPWTILIFAPRIEAGGGAPTRYVWPGSPTWPDPEDAIETAPEGTCIVIMPGTYNLTDTITFPADNITVRGCNRDGVVLNNTSGVNQTVLDFDDHDSITVKSLTLQQAVGNGGRLIDATSSPDSWIEDVKFVSDTTGSLGIMANAAARVRILDCYFVGAFEYAAYVLNSPDAMITGNVLDNSLNTALMYALYLQLSDRVTVIGNVLRMTGGISPTKHIYILNCDDLRIEGNTLSTTGTAPGVRLIEVRTTGRGIIIDGNQLLGAGGGNGIYLEAGGDPQFIDDTVISNNVIDDFPIAINIVHVDVRRTMIQGNNTRTCAAEVTDLGTDTWKPDIAPTVRVVAPSGGYYNDPLTAIHACNAGDKVWISAGTYNIPNTITFPAANITVEGDGRGAVVLNFTAADANACMALNGMDGITLRDFGLTAVAGKTGIGIDGLNCDDLIIEYVSVTGDGLTPAVRATVCNRLRIEHCVFECDTANVLAIRASDQYHIAHNDITAGQAGGAVRGIYGAASTGDGRIVDNDIKLTGAGVNAGYGIEVVDCQYTHISRNRIEILNSPVNARGVLLWSGASREGNVISDNVIVGDSGALVGDGIHLNNTVVATVLDLTLVAGNNVMYFNNGIRILLARVTNTFVHGNHTQSNTVNIVNGGAGTTLADNT